MRRRCRPRPVPPAVLSLTSALAPLPAPHSREGFSRDIATGACVEATPLPNCRKASRYDSTKCEECVIGYTRDFAGQCTQVGGRAAWPCVPPDVPHAGLPNRMPEHRLPSGHPWATGPSQAPQPH